MAKESVCGESKIMVSILLLVMVGAVAGLPQQLRLPEFQNFSPPEEVNAAFQADTHKVQRSISNHAGVDNTEDTIREVERLIKGNPELPRLTRGEILDILENITKHDQNNLLKSFGKESSSRDPKALMVVKAYTPLGSDGESNMEAFYTKPPITSIVEEDEPQQSITDKPQEVERKTTTENAPYFRRKTTKSPEVKKPSNPQIKRKPYRGTIQFRPTASDETNTITSTSRRERTTTEKPISTTTQTIYSSTRREITKRRRRPIVTSSTTTTSMPVTTYRPRRRQTPPKEIEYQNHKYPTRRPLYSSEGIKVITPPIMTTNPVQVNSDLEDLLPLEMVNGQRFVPLPSGVFSQQNVLEQSSIDLEIPDDLKQVAEDINLAAAQQQASKRTTQRVRFTPLSTTTTTTTESPNAFAVADSLSPEMQELLKNFGLLPDPNEISTKTDSSQFNPEKAEIDPKSYVGFKPLPQDNEGRKEMADLLSQYGLLDNRSSKSLKNTQKQISLDMVPDHLKPVLLDMGLTDQNTRTGRKVRQQPIMKTLDKDIEAESTSQHVFSPEVKTVSEENMKKLQRLLEIMKKLEKLNGTVTEESVDEKDRTELKELILSLKQSQVNDDIVTLNKQNAPNPVEFELGSNRNEVKREEEEEEEFVTVTAVSLPDDTVTPSIKDLEESFGGNSDTVTEALPEPTTPRRSGFYYLLDWNTFFEIDDQKGKRVNLRFQPKVGDPKRFLSVNIP